LNGDHKKGQEINFKKTSPNFKLTINPSVGTIEGKSSIVVTKVNSNARIQYIGDDKYIII